MLRRICDVLFSLFLSIGRLLVCLFFFLVIENKNGELLNVSGVLMIDNEVNFLLFI